MESNRQTTIPAGLQFAALVRQRIGDILAREMHDDGMMHLYHTGAYWTAFEHSAYRLASLCPYTRVTPLLVRGIPRAIVTACITDSLLASATRGLAHTTDTQNERAYRMTRPADTEGYRHWHQQQTGIIEGVALSVRNAYRPTVSYD